MLQLVTKIQELVNKSLLTQDIELNPKLRKINRIKTIHSSLQIEANSLSLEQVTDIINGKHVVGPDKDIQEAKNAFNAYESLLLLNPYDIKDLLKAHGFLMKGLTKSVGSFRQTGVGVFSGGKPIHIAPPQNLVPELIGNLIDWVKNSDVSDVLKSCIFHYEFEFIHPFTDGNGRMGRMWQTLLLCQHNKLFAYLPVEELVSQRQYDYYRAIRESTSANDSGIFANFMLNALYDSLKDLLQEQGGGIETKVIPADFGKSETIEDENDKQIAGESSLDTEQMTDDNSANVRQMSGKCPRNVREMSGKCAGRC
jgi:Fic family protein